METKEAIRRIKDHMTVHHMLEAPRCEKITEALHMAVDALWYSENVLELENQLELLSSYEATRKIKAIAKRISASNFITYCGCLEKVYSDLLSGLDPNDVILKLERRVDNE